MHALRALAVAALAFVAAPAVANETATAVQIASLNTAPAATGDSEFAQLFQTWKSFDGDSTAKPGQISSALPTRASLPSGIPLGRATLTSSYGMRVHPVLGSRKKHEGIDLAATRGTPVYAPADGTVAKAAWFGSYGNFIELEHGDAVETRYGHLSAYAVTAGQQVHKGDLIGYVGTTGRSTGPHLHYEVRVAGAPVDPTPYLADTQLAVSTDARLGRGGPQ